LSTSLLVTAQTSEPYRKMGRMQVLYNFILVEIEIRDFQIWLSRFCIAARMTTLQREISQELCIVEWTREPRQTNSSTIATSCPRTVTVYGSSSLLLIDTGYTN